MHYKFERLFIHDFRKLKNKALAKAILECVQKVSDAKTINDIANL